MMECSLGLLNTLKSSWHVYLVASPSHPSLLRQDLPQAIAGKHVAGTGKLQCNEKVNVSDLCQWLVYKTLDCHFVITLTCPAACMHKCMHMQVSLHSCLLLHLAYTVYKIWCHADMYLC